MDLTVNISQVYVSHIETIQVDYAATNWFISYTIELLRVLYSTFNV